MKLLGVFIIFIFSASYIGSCSYVAYERNSAFNKLNIGDTKDTAIKLFGDPSVVEKQGTPFTRYATSQCNDCEERLWYENRLGFDTKAWSIDFDGNGKVIKKNVWSAT